MKKRTGFISQMANFAAMKAGNRIKSGNTVYLLFISMSNDYKLEFELKPMLVIGKRIGKRDKNTPVTFLSKRSSYGNPSKPPSTTANFIFTKHNKTLKFVRDVQLGFYDKEVEKFFGLSYTAMTMLNDLAIVEEREAVFIYDENDFHSSTGGLSQGFTHGHILHDIERTVPELKD